jgi:hypothetical protein
LTALTTLSIIYTHNSHQHHLIQLLCVCVRNLRNTETNKSCAAQGMGGQLGYFGLFLDSSYGQGFCSESCTTYHSPMMSTTKEFEVSHLEVWAVGPPPPPPEELVSVNYGNAPELSCKKMNRFMLQGERSSVLDRDNEAKAILAMVGKEQKSDGLREPEPE